MRTNTVKRILAMVLSLTALLSLAACGGTKEEQATPAPEYVYKSEFTPISGQAAGMLAVKLYTEDGAYATCNEKVGREIPETADVANMTEEDLQRFDVYADNIYFIGNDGKAEKLPDYKPMAGKEDTQNRTDYYSQPYLGTVVMDDSGDLLTVETLYTGWYDGPEGKTYTDDDYYDYFKSSQEVYLRKLDKTGAELSCVQLETGADQYFNPSTVTDGSGNLLGALDERLCAFDAQGRQAYSIDCGYVNSVVKLADGQIIVSYWGDGGLSIAPLNSDAQSLGQSLNIPGDAYSLFAGGGSYDLYYTSGLNFYGYDIETQTADKLFNWLNCDVNSEDISLVKVDEDGGISGVISEYDQVEDSYLNQRITVTKAPYDPSTQKETLTLACLSLSENSRNAVIKFNRGSQNARIEIKDYSEFNTGDDSEAGLQRLLTEMMAGTVADIVALEGLPYRRIASKGILEDLYPYLDADSELKREDYFQNVMQMLEVDGKLCSVCPSFYVAAVMGAVSVVGEGPSWTYDEFAAALEKMPEGCEPFESGVSRDDILRVCVSLDMADYINWSTGQCSFDSKEFTDLLEFASGFPEQHTDESESTTQERISTGQQMLIATGIYRLDDVLYDRMYFAGQDVCYIGFPTNSGSGNVLTAENTFAMSSGCKDKEAAWQFLRTFMTEDYQKSNVWSIPTHLKAFEYKLAGVMKTEYMMDENGQYMLDENGEKIKQPRYTMSSDDGPVVNVYAMSQEQADQITAVINATTKFYDSDMSIISIVTEEAEAYFAGQKSAEEVAKLVQGKVNIYVNEQS